MRTLNLKGMSWIMALAMMFIVSFTSCSDDKEEGAITPVSYTHLTLPTKRIV